MKKLSLTPKQKKRASTMMALGSSEREAAESLIAKEKLREAVVHLYFSTYFISQALLADKIESKTNHKSLEAALHRHFGRRNDFPRRYIDLHVELHQQRTEFNYRTTHVPDPDDLSTQLNRLKAYERFALKVVPRVELLDILRAYHQGYEGSIKDFSFDVYCPKTYSHHTRLTLWLPPFYLGVSSLDSVMSHSRRMLQRLKVKRTDDYVLGLNSRIDQYADNHLVMIDVDAVLPAVEAALKPLGGVLLKTGRGFHFLGNTILFGKTSWESYMRRVLKNPTLARHIDKNHIQISLKRGYSTLRLTSSPVKPTTPYFYKEI